MNLMLILMATWMFLWTWCVHLYSVRRFRTTIKVIIEDEYLSVDGLTVGVEGIYQSHIVKLKMHHQQTWRYISFCSKTDLDGNTIKGAKTYSVVNVQPDNTGVTALILQEQ